MKYIEYQTNAQRTCPSLGMKMDLCHMVMGIHSESNELFQAGRALDIVNIGEEIADKIWYFSNYCSIRGYSLQEIFEKPMNNIFSEEYNSSQLTDIVKKYVIYNKKIDKDEEYHLLVKLAYNYLDMFAAHNLDIFKALNNNIDKLRIRFPEKFIQQLANNRDLISERAELEK